jgi:quercetin dioxygenase-like cupin family protein
MVSFGKGVRNKFHAHESDQILIVTEGKGIVSTEGAQKEVTVGDVILFSAGEKHWHGACDESTFAHIAISRAESKTTQIEE